jgi:hypothetical protein
VAAVSAANPKAMQAARLALQGDLPGDAHSRVSVNSIILCHG